LKDRNEGKNTPEDVFFCSVGTVKSYPAKALDGSSGAFPKVRRVAT